MERFIFFLAFLGGIAGIPVGAIYWKSLFWQSFSSENPEKSTSFDFDCFSGVLDIFGNFLSNPPFSFYRI